MSSILYSCAKQFDRYVGEDFQEQMIQLGMRGLSLKESGDYFGLDEDDWIEFCEENPIIEARHNCGKARGIALAGQKLLQQINEGRINAITFYLKTQGNYIEKSVTRLEGTVRNQHMPRPPVPVDPVEAAKFYQEFMKDS